MNSEISPIPIELKGERKKGGNKVKKKRGGDRSRRRQKGRGKKGLREEKGTAVRFLPSYFPWPLREKGKVKYAKKKGGKTTG